MNGAASRAEPAHDGVQLVQALDDHAGRLLGHEPGDRERQLGAQLAVARDRDAAADLGEALDAARDVVVATPTTTMLCASCATVVAKAPRRRPKPRTSPRPIAAGRVVALDHRELREVALGVGEDAAVADGWRRHEVLGES